MQDYVTTAAWLMVLRGRMQVRLEAEAEYLVEQEMTEEVEGRLADVYERLEVRAQARLPLPAGRRGAAGCAGASAGMWGCGGWGVDVGCSPCGGARRGGERFQ